MITRTPDKVMYLLQLEKCTGLPHIAYKEPPVSECMPGCRDMVAFWCRLVTVPCVLGAWMEFLVVILRRCYFSLRKHPTLTRPTPTIRLYACVAVFA